MKNSVFGLKFVANSKHCYISGHVATTEGNCEWSAAGPCDDAQKLATVLREAVNTLESIHRWSTCGHNFEFNGGELYCYHCGFKKPCDHSRGVVSNAGETTCLMCNKPVEVPHD